MKKLLAILVIVSIVAGVMLFLPWLYHLFVTGLNPFMIIVLIILFPLLALPLVIRGLRWVKLQWPEQSGYLPAILFLVAGVIWLITGAFTYRSTVDIQLHDTLYVISRVHITYVMAIFFGSIAALYFLFSKAFAHGWFNTMSFVHFWVTLIGCYVIFWPHTYEGLAGMPRRYIDYSSSFGTFVQFNQTVGLVAIITIMMQVVFAGMIGYSLLGKRFFTR